MFQDPWASLNPRMRVGSIVGEPLEINSPMTHQQIRSRVGEVLEEVGLQTYQANLYPHEFSGGQRQRIAMARALALNPKVVVLDEPVSGLDVSIRAQIMNLLKDLQAEHDLSYLLIAHHLATVRYLCDRVGVMYLGRIVEEADTEELFENPLHPYTRALMSAALPSHPDVEREEIILTGEVPSPVRSAPGVPLPSAVSGQVRALRQPGARGARAHAGSQGRLPPLLLTKTAPLIVMPAEAGMTERRMPDHAASPPVQ